MPALEEAADILRRLRNSQKLKVHIFTHRPWPFVSNTSNKIRKEWTLESKTFTAEVYKGKRWWCRFFLWVKSVQRELPYRWQRVTSLMRRDAPIDQITKAWLAKNGFEYDAIMIEKGSEDVADPGGHIHNRFYACRMIPIRYFVEDDLITAKKLAFICDVVLLWDQPYNQGEALPANVIRVSSWQEISHRMRELW